MRIASLLPSTTEICFALGLGPSLVGVTHECDFPPQAEYKPVLTANQLPGNGSPAEVDRHVREALHQGSSLYRLDHQQLQRARPDLIITQELCEVCAVAYPQVLEAARVLPGHPTVMSVEPTTLAGVLRSILDVGQATGTRERAEELVRGLWARVDAVRGAVAGRPHRRVACLEWTDPLMVAGHWVPDQVTTAGGDDVLGAAGVASRAIEFEELREADPELILCIPCGYRLEGAEEQARQLSSRPGWEQLSAARSGEIYALDGSWYFNRPGPRVIDGIEILARILHPEGWKGPVPAGFSRIY